MSLESRSTGTPVPLGPCGRPQLSSGFHAGHGQRYRARWQVTYKGVCSPRVPALSLALIHPSAWKGASPKLGGKKKGRSSAKGSSKKFGVDGELAHRSSGLQRIALMLTHTSHACTSGRVNPSAGPYLYASCDVGQPHRNPLLYAPFSDPDGNGWTLQQLPY